MSVALAANWLNTSAAFGETNLPGSLTNSANLWWPYPYDLYRPYYQAVRWDADPKPIKLTSVEVDRLRLAAKRDAKLKAVLQKFTPHIEVEVEL